jgi:hypothetical protein
MVAIADRLVEVLEIEDVAGDHIGIRLPALCRCGALIDETQHALLEEALRLFAHRRTVDPRLSAPCCDGLIGEHHGANHVIVVLDGITKAQHELMKVIGHRPTSGSPLEGASVCQVTFSSSSHLSRPRGAV